MSDFFRRASDAFHHRPRQDSTGSTSSTEGVMDSSTTKAPDQQPLNQNLQTTQPQPNESLAGAGTAKPKQHHLWGWKHGQEGTSKTDPSQMAQKKGDTDWVIGT
ncbi:hypothetical protein N7488_005333 [Penicillium malachiteum]|nr:hypothetical protein N7488_005333 [Penicillium malachiteum]